MPRRIGLLGRRSDGFHQVIVETREDLRESLDEANEDLQEAAEEIRETVDGIPVPIVPGTREVRALPQPPALAEHR